MSKSIVNIVLSSHGDLIEPNIHDAKLVAIKLGNSNANFDFELMSGETITATLENIVRMCCNNFLEANIVLDMALTSGLHVDDELLEKIIIPPAILTERHTAYIKETQKSIFKGDLTFVEINNSYGCQVYALCKKVEFSKLNNT